MSYCLSRTNEFVEVLKEGLEAARWAVQNLERGTVYYRDYKGRMIAYKRTGSGQRRRDIRISEPSAFTEKMNFSKRLQAERDLRINWDSLLNAAKACKEGLQQDYAYLASRYLGIPHCSMSPVNTENLIHKTARGELVRSKSEVIIANALHAAKVDYYYEFPYVTEEGNGKIYYPDFTIPISIQGRTVYWEHCGYIKDPTYAANWIKKKIKLQEEGILENINLIVTYDSYYGEIDSQEIQNIIRRWFLPPK